MHGHFAHKSLPCINLLIHVTTSRAVASLFALLGIQLHPASTAARPKREALPSIAKLFAKRSFAWKEGPFSRWPGMPYSPTFSWTISMAFSTPLITFW